MKLQRAAGLAMLAYYVGLAAFRCSVRGVSGAYDLLWLCNVAILAAAIGLLMDSPRVRRFMLLLMLLLFFDVAGLDVSVGLL